MLVKVAENEKSRTLKARLDYYTGREGICMESYEKSELKIADVVDFLNIDLLLFFIINNLLVKLNLIDISYDFQYNKIYTKINLNTSKQNLSENLIYQKLEEFFALFN